MKRILVADDDKQALKLFQRIFQDQDYELAFADNGADALEKSREFAPDLMVLDIVMPGMNGYDVCHSIKSNPQTSGTMVLMLSGQNRLEDRLKGYQAKADDYLIKPYESRELVAKVSILLRLKKAQDQVKALNRNLERLVMDKTRALVRKERQAIIGLMVQGIVHNLKGPLTLAQWATEEAFESTQTLMSQFNQDAGESHALAKLIESDIFKAAKQIDKTFQLVGTLLIKGRQEANKFVQKLDLNDLIQKECDILEADMALKHEVVKQQHFDPDLPGISGIYSDFSQVIYNLISNALDAMKHSEKKQLVIRTVNAPEDIVITISDTGAGIEPEHMDRIFDPFFTTKPKEGQSGASEEPTGTGLGLYTCQQLMGEYGAKLSAESKPGIGTTMTIRIPKNCVIQKEALPILTTNWEKNPKEMYS